MSKLSIRQVLQQQFLGLQYIIVEMATYELLTATDIDYIRRSLTKISMTLDAAAKQNKKN